MNKNLNSDLQITKKERKELPYYIEGLKNFEINIIAQIITLVESHQVDDYKLSQKILDECLRLNKVAKKIGISGIPGVGKSTFIETLGLTLIERGEKIAILAVDPSSDITGGSILGDKTRMQKLSESKNAFVRPSPSKGILGGVAQKTYEAIIVCEAAGFDTIIVETVGVGQSETIIAHMVDFFLLLSLANTGDDLQGIKRGILEQANAIIFTKNDGQNIKATLKAQTELRQSIQFLINTIPNWKTPILSSSSLNNEGFADIRKMIDNYFKTVKESNYFKEKRTSQNIFWFKSSIDYFLTSYYMSNPKLKSVYQNVVAKLKDNKMSATGAAKLFIDHILSQK